METTEDNILRLIELLKRAYEKLAECEDSRDDFGSWRSIEQQDLMDEIADALLIEEKDRL